MLPDRFFFPDGGSVRIRPIRPDDKLRLNLVAVARAVRFSDQPDTMEMAVVVGDHLHGRGLGRELAMRLSDLAQERGVRYFAATMFGENVVARRLVRSVARRFEDGPHAGGLREVRAELAPHADHAHAVAIHAVPA